MAKFRNLFLILSLSAAGMLRGKNPGRAAARLIILGVLATVLAWPQAARAATWMTTSDEVAMGRSAAQSLEKHYGLVKDQALQERINAIGQRIAAVCDRKDLKYSFKVLDSRDVNALSLPGGYVYVFRGLVETMPSDDELAAIIGHEVGHIVKKHALHQMEKQGLFSILLLLASMGNADVAVALQQTVLQAIMAGYSRADEQEADHLGFLYAWRAGFNPYGMSIGLSKLADLERDKSGYSIFSSHPEPAARLALLDKYLAEADIRPQVVLSDKSAYLRDGKWQSPPLTATYGGYKPAARADFFAGNLYRLRGLPEVDPAKLVMVPDEGGMTLYYQGRLLVTVTAGDAASAGLSVTDFAEACAASVREWLAGLPNARRELPAQPVAGSGQEAGD